MVYFMLYVLLVLVAMGHMFVGALAYTDDIVLISPSAHGMRSVALYAETV